MKPEYQLLRDLQPPVQAGDVLKYTGGCVCEVFDVAGALEIWSTGGGRAPLFADRDIPVRRIWPAPAPAAGVELTTEIRDVVSWAQAVLTAWNVGDLEKGSLLHLKLREVMIAYRDSLPEPAQPTLEDKCATEIINIIGDDSKANWHERIASVVRGAVLLAAEKAGGA